MKACVLLKVALLLLVLTATVPGAAQSQSLTVTLKGSSVEPASGFGYALDFALESDVSFDVIHVYAEPSHTLLLVYAQSKAEDLDKIFFEASLVGAAAVAGDPATGRGSFLTPFRPSARDNRIRVLLRDGDSEILIADARVNLRRFEFSSTIHLGLFKSGGTTYNHCCKSPTCGPLCTACGGPYFFCDLANCTEAQCL